jgi:hypothetical protein
MEEEKVPWVLVEYTNRGDFYLGLIVPLRADDTPTAPS